MKHSHHEQKHVQHLPDHNHIHHDGAARQGDKDREHERRGERHHMSHEAKSKRDEKRGEKEYSSHSAKDRRDEKRGEENYSKKKMKK